MRGGVRWIEGVAQSVPTHGQAMRGPSILPLALVIQAEIGAHSTRCWMPRPTISELNRQSKWRKSLYTNRHLTGRVRSIVADAVIATFSAAICLKGREEADPSSEVITDRQPLAATLLGITIALCLSGCSSLPDGTALPSEVAAAQSAMPSPIEASPPPTQVVQQDAIDERPPSDVEPLRVVDESVSAVFGAYVRNTNMTCVVEQGVNCASRLKFLAGQGTTNNSGTSTILISDVLCEDWHQGLNSPLYFVATPIGDEPRLLTFSTEYVPDEDRTDPTSVVDIIVTVRTWDTSGSTVRAAFNWHASARILSGCED